MADDLQGFERIGPVAAPHDDMGGFERVNPTPRRREGDVLNPIINFVDYPARALAADLYSSVDAAKQQMFGGHPSRERWWEMRDKALAAGELPESPIGKTVSGALALPGRAVSAVVSGLSDLVFGHEHTQQLALPATVAMDVATPFLAGRAMRESATPVAPKAPGGINMAAADIVGERLAKDAKYGGPTATEAIEKIGEGRALRKPMTLADVGEENIRALGGYVARQPGESRALTRSFLEARDQAASQRLAQDVGQYVFSGPTMMQSTEDLLQARSRAARPLYQDAEALQGIWSPRLQEFIGEPNVRKGLGRGFELERLDALAEGRKFDPTQLGVDLDFEGNIVMKSVPNLRVLDMGKRGLDAMIADERDAITGRLSARGVALSKVRGAYVNEIDGLDTSGKYRVARDAWAGPSRSLDAMRWGRTIFNRAPEETARDFAMMPANEQEFVRLGVADVLRERIAKTGFTGNEARAIIKNSWTQDQLKPIFRSEEDFNKFSDAVMAEHAMAGTTSKVLRGSQTAERQVEDKSGLTPEVATSAAYAASHVIHGNFPMALVHAWRIQRRLRKDVGEDPALNEAVAKIIFNPDIQIADPEMQRIVTGPPASRASSMGRNVAERLGLYGPLVADPGLNSSPPQ